MPGLREIPKGATQVIVDIFVVAGSKKEFDNLCTHAAEQWNRELRNKQVHYVEDASDLEMADSARVFCYGTYHQRPDWETIYYKIVEGGHRMLRIR